jgi:putative heme-binding domain-containing protein
VSRLFALSLLAALLAGPCQAQEFQSLFNGRDLTGWEGDPKLWSVKDGAITGATDGNIPTNTFLIWKGTAADFELHAQFRLQGGNSGIQYRSKHLKDAGNFVVGGYQADMDAGNRYTGILYEERGRGILAERGQKVFIAANGKRTVTGALGEAAKLTAAIKPNDWNEYVIVARGNKLTHTINGQPMIEVVDEQADKRALDGIIALQLHRGFRMVVQFKDIRMKKLPAAPVQPARDAQPPVARVSPHWIWLGAQPREGQAALFRREVVVPDGLTAARLTAVAGGEMTITIDGREVLTGGKRPVAKDVTAELRATPAKGNRHVVVARVRNSSGPAGFLARLVFEAAGREPAAVVSDESWRAAPARAAAGRGAGRPRSGPPPLPDESQWVAATVVGKLGDKPRESVTESALKAAVQLREPTATPAESLKVAKGFKAELLYSVPKDVQGSWVNMCVDPKGRLIVSDQYGPLYRITPPPIGGSARATTVEKIDLQLGGAHGLLWAFDSLYVMVNEGPAIGGGEPLRRGLYRARSKDGGDTFEAPEFLHVVPGQGEHGSHAILPGPDGKSLYIVCGNQTKMISPLANSRVPRLWGEDHLLPRMPDGRGFMAGVLGPGGCIYKIDPDGKDWELVSTGYRNEFDAAFNRQGDLFTYDADMEWDINTPWYRPTRVCLAASGSEFGWRNGAGKWPPYYPDSLPAIYNVGPGSPTGVCFGYGAKFPAKYQDAFFMCDWSYGKLYALHLTPDGAAYKSELEEFLNGSPLPLTDVVVNPKDGALYFTIGGRRTQSGLYRVTYVGPESTAPSAGGPSPGPLHVLRHQLEAFHGHQDPKAVETAWPYLGHEDRYIRFAARVAIEHQDPKTWQDRALKETDPARALGALLALVRAVGQDPFHHPRSPANAVPGAAIKGPILDALGRIDWAKLTNPQRLDLLRVYAVLFNRLGWPDRAARDRVIQRFDPLFPAQTGELNAMLCELLVYLEAPGVAGKALRLMAAAPTQEEQMEYAKSLRALATGWTAAQRQEYFSWYLKAAHYKGGASFQGFLDIMKRDAVASLTAKEKEELRPVLEAKPAAPEVAVKPRPFVKSWTVAELAPKVEAGLKDRDFDRGRRLFGEANCFSCHRFDNEGGAQGPDLTAAAGRFNVRDLLESIIEPSKEISDQYAAVTMELADGRFITGRIVNLNGDSFSVMTNMLDPNGLTNVNRKLVLSTEKSPVSMMPAGLLDTFKEDEILDLMAYLLSRGDRRSAMFQKK